jgi:hypothetical protein
MSSQSHPVAALLTSAPLAFIFTLEPALLRRFLSVVRASIVNAFTPPVRARCYVAMTAGVSS